MTRPSKDDKNMNQTQPELKEEEKNTIGEPAMTATQFLNTISAPLKSPGNRTPPLPFASGAQPFEGVIQASPLQQGRTSSPKYTNDGNFKLHDGSSYQRRNREG
jgi:hypothetical protein